MLQAATSTVRLELTRTGGISNCPEATRIEQPLTNLSSWCLLFVLQMSWLSPSAVALASARRPSRGSMRGQRREGRPLCRAGAEVLLGPVGSCGRKFTALGIRLSFLQHVPDNRGQLSHHGHARDGGSPPAFDLFEPLPYQRAPGYLLRHPSITRIMALLYSAAAISVSSLSMNIVSLHADFEASSRLVSV